MPTRTHSRPDSRQAPTFRSAGRTTVGRGHLLGVAAAALLALAPVACETTSGRPVSSKPGTTKKSVSKSPAAWGAVSGRAPDALP